MTTITKNYESVSLALAASNYNSTRIMLRGETKLCMHVKAVSQAFDLCKVWGRAHEEASDVDFTPGTWATPTTTSRVNRSNGVNLTTLAAGGEGYFEMDVTGLTSVIMQFSPAVNGGSAEVRYSLR